MTTAYLSRGATSLADANWSDTSGFSATYPNLVVNQRIGDGVEAVTTSVDFSSPSKTVYGFWVAPGAQGILGSSSNRVKFDADNESASSAGDQASAFVANFGSGVALHYEAAGTNSLCKNLSIGSGPNGEPNQLYFYAGTATNVGILSSTFRAYQGSIITNLDAYGGNSEIEYNSTAITLYRAMGGVHIVRRKVTAFEIGGDARVFYLPDDQVTDFSSTSLKMTASSRGQFIIDRGAIPTINALSGNLDFSRLREEITPGGTAFNVGGAKVIPSDLVDLSNAEPLYGTKRPVGGFVPLP